jgi:hypothetical protein
MGHGKHYEMDMGDATRPDVDPLRAAERVINQPGGVRGFLRRDQPSALHPLTGLAILGLDWVIFGAELLSAFVLQPLLSPLGALAGFISAFLIERRYADRSFGRSVLAALFAAVVVGVPWPVSGTLIGLAVLALSGLRGR